MHPAGVLKPNDLGLFDTLGNVFEWCTDAYHDAYQPAKDGRATVDALMDAMVWNEDVRVLRGGAFNYSPAVLRSANRGRLRPANRDTNFGLRPARTYD